MARIVSINGEEFTIDYLDSDNKHAIASIARNRIIIKLPKRWPHHEKVRAAERLEKRIARKLTKSKIKFLSIPAMDESERKRMAKEQLPRVKARAEEINTAYFNSSMGKVRIKMNSTNWGSCSVKNNISINFALLFLPQEFMDYVIVHELAHTKMRNHSKEFWKIIEGIIPDHRRVKKELRKYALTN